MTLDDLRVFAAVCEANNLSAVARQLGCTQPAVSQHITRLERELDTILLHRSASGVTPTAAGYELRATALESLGVIAAGVHRIKSLEGEQTRSLTITTGGTTVRHFLRTSVVRFRRRNPDVILNFVPANSTARCLEHLRAAKADLALVTVDQPRRGIEQQVLAHQSLRLLVPRATDWARRKRVSIKDLADMRYIGLSERTSSSGYIEQALEDHAVGVQRVITVDDFDTACVFVELGLGHAIVPAVHAANFARSAQVTSLAISGLRALPIGLAARRFASLSAPAGEFADVFKQELNRMRRIPGLSVLNCA